MPTWPQLLLPGTLIALAAVGAWLDWHRRLLPNWLCGIAGAAGLGAALLGPAGGPVWSNAVHAVIALVVGMALFAGGVIGGGDAKFYAALALWFPLDAGFRLLLLVSLAGLILTLAMWVLIWRREPAGTSRQTRSVPYGVAIAAGAVIQTLFMQAIA